MGRAERPRYQPLMQGDWLLFRGAGEFVQAEWSTLRVPPWSWISVLARAGVSKGTSARAKGKG